MYTILIAVQATAPDYQRILDEHLSVLGHKCHILASTWALRTLLSPEEVRARLAEGVLSNPGDRFIVAELNQDWLEHNCKSAAGCYNLVM